jgi:hypothetical protein
MIPISFDNPSSWLMSLSKLVALFRCPDFKSMLADAGFVNIVEIRKKIPINGWPKDSRYKELGNWSCRIIHDGIQRISIDY